MSEWNVCVGRGMNRRDFLKALGLLAAGLAPHVADANGLTESQVACVRVNGQRIVLDGSGYAKRVGFALIVR